MFYSFFWGLHCKSGPSRLKAGLFSPFYRITGITIKSWVPRCPQISCVFCWGWCPEPDFTSQLWTQSAQWALFGHWLSLQLCRLLSGEHVCSHKEFNKLTMNKVAWKRHRLTHAVSCQEAACQIVVFANLKGKFPGPPKYTEMFPCLAVLEKNTIMAEEK